MHDSEKSFSRMTGYALILAIAAISFSGCGSDNEGGGEGIYIDSVTPAAASAGDIVTIEGSGFSTDPSKNAVIFTAAGVSSATAGRDAVPVEATGSSLRVEVPEGSFTGGVSVRSPFPIKSGPFDITPPGIPSNSLDFTVRMLRGDVAKIFYAGSNYDLPVSTGGAGEDYILILFDGATPPDRNMTFNYSVDNDTPCSPGAAADGPDAESGPEADRTDPLLLAGAGDVTRSFERKKWEEISGLLSGGAVNIDTGGTPPVQSRSQGLEPQASDFVCSATSAAARSIRLISRWSRRT